MIERKPRKNLFLSATAEAAGVSAPVRIRNLSEDGAMIDGPALPEVGSTFLLRRLDVAVEARVIWNEGGRCGVKFAAVITIDDWVAGAVTARTGSLGQTRVDAIQAAIRSGQALPVGAGFDPPVAQTVDDLPARIVAELALVREMLEDVADDLTEDLEVLTRHAEALQNFDVATQIIQHLGEVLGSADQAGTVTRLPMHDLRNRLLGTPAAK